MKKRIVSKSGREIELRPPEEGDVEAVMQMFNEIVEEDVYLLVNEKQSLEEERKWMETSFKEMAEKKLVRLFAFDGERLVGNCDVKKGRYRSAHVGLLGIIIRNGYRGDGIGKQLAEEVLHMARERLGVSLVELHVYSENEMARNLYSKLGFVECGMLPGAVEYKGRMIDQIHMYTPLTQDCLK